MFRKRVVILLVIIIVGMISIIYLLLRKPTTQFADVVNAVPINSALIIESDNFFNLLESLHEENEIWNELTVIPVFKRMDNQIVFLDSLFENNDLASRLIKDNSILISTHLIGKNKFEFLYLFSLVNSGKEEKYHQLINELLVDKADISERLYNNILIYDVKLYKGNEFRNFSYAISNGVFIISFSPLLVEDAIRQLDSENNLMKDKGFKKVLKTAGKNVDANIYINYKTFPKFTSLFLDNRYSTRIHSITDFADWTELDLSIKENELVLYGYTYTNDSLNNYQNILLNQSPESIDIESVLPSNTSCFTGFVFSDLDKYKEDYKNYLSRSGLINQYNKNINSIKNDLNIDIEEMFYSFIEDEIAVAFTDVNISGIDEAAYVVVHTKSQSLAEENLIKLLSNHAQKSRKTLSDYIYTYTIDKESAFPIYTMPVSNIMNKLFGGIFKDIATSHFTFIDNYLIFGGSVKSLSKFIHYNVLQKTLENDDNYQMFADNLSSKTTFYFYSNFAHSKSLISNYLNKELKQTLENNISTIQKFEGIAIQLSSNNNLIYNNIYLNYNPVFEEEPRTIWESHLDTLFDFKPRLLTNHVNKEKEIFVQDHNNTIYLINRSGRIQWKIPLSERIISDIYQVDFYKNGKLQILFSTKNKIFMIDRLGNNVEKYPISLRSPATNGIALFDYDNSRDYRIFIACDNKKVYAYSQEGDVLNGWEFNKTETFVKADIQHFRFKEKDYIVFSDSLKTYVLDRRGKTRVVVKNQFAKSRNNKFYLENYAKDKDPRLVTTDATGKVIYLYFDGNVEKIDVDNYSSDHYFMYEDVDGDGSNDYIFIDEDEIEVFDKKQRTIFSYDFDEDIHHKPAFYEFSNNESKIGVVSDLSNKIYLFNSDGKLYDGFPLVGKTEFSIGHLGKSNTNFNLVVGNEESSIYNYEVP